MARAAKGAKAKADAPSTSRKRTWGESQNEAKEEAPSTSKKAAAGKKEGSSKTAGKRETTIASNKGVKAKAACKKVEQVEEKNGVKPTVKKTKAEKAEDKKRSPKKTNTKKIEGVEEIKETPAKRRKLSAKSEKSPVKKTGKKTKDEQDEVPKIRKDPNATKKGRNATKVEEEDDCGPSTSKKPKKENISDKKKATKGRKDKEEEEEEEHAIPKRRELSKREIELIALIKTEEAKQNALKVQLAAQNLDTDSALIEKQRVGTVHKRTIKEDAESRKKLAALTKKVTSAEMQNQKRAMKISINEQKIRILEIKITRMQAIMESKDVQSARRGREALTLRTENRRLKRYLSVLRSSLERMSLGRPTPFFERLLEMAEEDFDPEEERRRMREEIRAGRDPNSIYL